MNNSDIYKYVNSKDIRQHLVNINYQFSALEAAWLVHQCASISLEERIAAWEGILTSYPDQSVESFHFDKPIESLHQVLSQYISFQKKLIKNLTKNESNSFYQYCIVEDGFPYNYDCSPSFSSYIKCFEKLSEELQNCNCLYACIRKITIDDVNGNIEAKYSPIGILSGIKPPDSDTSTEWVIKEFFDLIWLCFPAPFEEGDILYDPYHPNHGEMGGPVVMTGITPIYYAKDGMKHCDTSDMIVAGFFQNKSSGTIYHEVTWNYMDYEYYPQDKLIGKQRILKALSNLQKNKINIELFIKAYHLIILEEVRNDLMPNGWFTEEGLELAGLK